MTGKEAHYLYEAVYSGKISGDGSFTKRCHEFFENRYGFQRCFMTPSCTDALEMASILMDLTNGDEVILPSYSFVSTANAFILQGAKLVFADSEQRTPNIDATRLEELITHRTKAIVLVQYAGIACEMDKIMQLADKYNLFVVEDAAQAIDAYYNDVPLGKLGHFGAFSFHETKNVISGEGGMLTVNDPNYIERAEIIREKGTNRSAFFRGEVDKYNWVDVGSSFLPSDIISAFLYAQLENLDDIQAKRIAIWDRYYKGLKSLEEQGLVQLPVIPDFATNNAHLFYVVCHSSEERSGLIAHLKSYRVGAVFHYISLHKSPFYRDKHDGRELPMSDHYSDCLVRLPMYYELALEEVDWVVSLVKEFFLKDS